MKAGRFFTALSIFVVISSISSFAFAEGPRGGASKGGGASHHSMDQSGGHPGADRGAQRNRESTKSNPHVKAAHGHDRNGDSGNRFGHEDHRPGMGREHGDRFRNKERMDRNDDGSVDRFETHKAKRMMKENRQDDSNHPRHKSFRQRADQNHDGEIDQAERSRAGKVLERRRDAQEGMEHHPAREFRERADFNNDGVVDHFEKERAMRIRHRRQHQNSSQEEGLEQGFRSDDNATAPREGEFAPANRAQGPPEFDRRPARGRVDQNDNGILNPAQRHRTKRLEEGSRGDFRGQDADGDLRGQSGRGLGEQRDFRGPHNGTPGFQNRPFKGAQNPNGDQYDNNQGRGRSHKSIGHAGGPQTQGQPNGSGPRRQGENSHGEQGNRPRPAQQHGGEHRGGGQQ